MYIVSLDVGTRTIGVARGELTTKIITPLLTLRRKSVRVDTDRLTRLCQEQRAEKIVVGLPYEEDGKEGRSARLARQIGEALKEKTGLELYYQDERYSTVEARYRLSEAGTKARKQKRMIDQVAAVVILEDWFSMNKRPPSL